MFDYISDSNIERILDTLQISRIWKEPKVIKTKKVVSPIKDANVVVVYGNVKGNITGCENVVIINGDVKGSIENCINVLGTISDYKD